MYRNLPFVSVLIPVKNEEIHIKKCIESIRCQDYPKELYEIVVMDNGSNDRTPNIVEGMGISVYRSNSRTIGKVRNELFWLSKGEVVAYIDGDCTAPPSWIRETISLLINDNIGAIGGYINRPENSNWLVSAWALKKPLIDRVADRLATGSFFIKRKVFISVNGFDETLTAGEDTDISRRIINLNKLLLRATSASVTHWGYPETILSFLKRQIWQTSDYLLTMKGRSDAIFFITLASVFSFFGFIFGIILKSYEVAFILIALYMAMPGALALYRISKSSEERKVGTIVKVYFASLLYLIGRSIGLIISLSRFALGKYANRNNKIRDKSVP